VRVGQDVGPMYVWALLHLPVLRASPSGTSF
jgi:hypothetical protein